MGTLMRFANQDLLNSITAQLDQFFEAMLKAADAFSYKIAHNELTYSKRAFETTVISPEGLDDLIDEIHYRLFPSWGRDESIVSKAFILKEFERFDRVLSPLIRCHETTKRITCIAENVVDDSFSHAFGAAGCSPIVEHAVGNVGIGHWLLAENSGRAQTNQFQKDVFNRIQGMLLNTKIRIKIQMMENFAEYERDCESIAI